MNKEALSVGAVVTAEYKSGLYAGKLVELSPPRALIEVAAVLRHPLQGDLHHPYEPDVPMFHQRRAASRREKVWVIASVLRPFEGGLPEYEDSLREAIDGQITELKQLTLEGVQLSPIDTDRAERLQRWAAKALEQAEAVRRDYGF